MIEDPTNTYYNETAAAGIQERDVDLVLVEELSCSLDFVHWLCSQAGYKDLDYLAPSLAEVEVKHSCLFIGEGYGESDIIMRTKDRAGRRHLYLIEDKIDATFTHDQVKRYKTRLQTMLATDGYADGRTILIAPQSFISTRVLPGDFDTQISYESLIIYFENRANTCELPEIALRCNHRSGFLRRAVEKKSYNGPVLNPDPRVCDFRNEYADIVSTIAPELRLGVLSKVKEPNEWFQYRGVLVDSVTPSRFLLIHKPKGEAAIQVSSKEKEMRSSIMDSFRNLIWSDMRLKDTGKNGKSFSVVIRVPELNMRRGVSAQAQVVNEAIRSLQRLHNWYNQNYPALHAILSPTISLNGAIDRSIIRNRMETNCSDSSSHKERRPTNPASIRVGEKTFWGCDQTTIRQWVETHLDHIFEHGLSLSIIGKRCGLKSGEIVIWTTAYREVGECALQYATELYYSLAKGR